MLSRYKPGGATFRNAALAHSLDLTTLMPLDHFILGRRTSRRVCGR
jgi:hypothetical protein